DRIASDYMPTAATKLVRLCARLLPVAVIANSKTTLATLTLDRGPKRARALAAIGSPTHLAGTGRPTRAREGAEVTIGMVGRIQPWKGQDVFLRAFAAAFPQGGANAVVIGGPLFGEDVFLSELEELASSLGVAERVRFTGHLEDPYTEMDNLDVLVHASVIPEPFGQVVVEGMALGLPVVAAAAGGPAEVITNGIDGMLCPPGDELALAGCLRRLAADPSLRERLGSAAARTARQFAPEAIAARVEEVYKEALRARRGRRTSRLP
ncbi:MAG TPA: glycosyltransferase, partial [Acidimicrobiales bacterium]|nr:glycosyltransferase [Acidimicrobiales bacterium]